jgi:hypothetical protein
MPPAVDLTGAWAADDGATYYIRQLGDGSVTWVGLNDSGFHSGMDFTNVFRGHVSPDETTLSGDWADVPRGESNNSGTLSLDIVASLYGPTIGSNELRQKAGGTSGGFGGKVWRRGLFPSGPFPLGPHDIKDIDGRVQRYDKPLGENNPPCRDFTVMWGSITKVDWPSLPPENTYCSFIKSGHGWFGTSFMADWGGDGDFSFDLLPDFSRMSAYFWVSDWVDGPFDDFDGPANEHILSLFDRHKLFHCEAAMYGRENDEDHCADSPVILLPGWQESAGNSVLANGRPINGSFVEVTVNDHRIGAPPSPYKALRFGGGAGGRQVDLTPGAVARITGVVADDAGHEDEVPPEIHPVYAIDVVQDFGARRPDGNVNLTGAWHANDIGTYYLRQIGNTLWWLGMSRDQGRTFANVFHGTIAGNVIEGGWVDVPMGAGGARSGGSLTLIGETLSTELTKISQTNLFGALAWTKLYDT